MGALAASPRLCPFCLCLPSLHGGSQLFRACPVCSAVARQAWPLRQPGANRLVQGHSHPTAKTSEANAWCPLRARARPFSSRECHRRTGPALLITRTLRLPCQLTSQSGTASPPPCAPPGRHLLVELPLRSSVASQGGPRALALAVAFRLGGLEPGWVKVLAMASWDSHA